MRTTTPELWGIAAASVMIATEAATLELTVLRGVKRKPEAKKKFSSARQYLHRLRYWGNFMLIMDAAWWQLTPFNLWSKCTLRLCCNNCGISRLLIVCEFVPPQLCRWFLSYNFKLVDCDWPNIWRFWSLRIWKIENKQIYAQYA